MVQNTTQTKIMLGDDLAKVKDALYSAPHKAVKMCLLVVSDCLARVAAKGLGSTLPAALGQYSLLGLGYRYITVHNAKPSLGTISKTAYMYEGHKPALQNSKDYGAELRPQYDKHGFIGCGSKIHRTV